MFLMPTDNMLHVNCCTVVVTARIMSCSCDLRGSEGLPYVGIGNNMAENKDDSKDGEKTGAVTC